MDGWVPWALLEWYQLWQVKTKHGDLAIADDTCGTGALDVLLYLSSAFGVRWVAAY